MPFRKRKIYKKINVVVARRWWYVYVCFLYTKRVFWILFLPYSISSYTPNINFTISRAQAPIKKQNKRRDCDGCKMRRKEEIEIFFSLQFYFQVRFARNFYRTEIFGRVLSLLKFLHARKWSAKAATDPISNKNTLNPRGWPRNYWLKLLDAASVYLFHLIMPHNILWHYCEFWSDI